MGGEGATGSAGEVRVEWGRSKGVASEAASVGTSVQILPQMSQLTAASNH